MLTYAVQEKYLVATIVVAVIEDDIARDASGNILTPPTPQVVK
jgi:hypothetical protein